MKARLALLIPLGALAAGCSSPGAIFVTKSSLAIADLDSTPKEFTMAMHRVEGFIAPRNQNGNTPPVLAHITSNRELVNPEVQQVYATGTAAERLSGDYKSNNSECDSDQCKKEENVSPVVFTTSTTFGLRIGMSPENVVDGVVIGYRRKEMSFVPSLAMDTKGTYRYPSLIAAINLSAEGNRSGKFSACQGFATGTAATRLAESDDAGLGCLGEGQSVKRLLTSRQGVELRQQAEIARALRCYVGLPDERKHSVRTNAEMLKLIPRGRLVQVADAGELKTAPQVDNDERYARELLNSMLPTGAEPADASAALAGAAVLREHQLRAHREYACEAPLEAAQ